MLIVEDLLLLLTDDRTGKPATGGEQVDLALGGALLIDLTLAGRVDVAGPSEQVREGRLVVRDQSPTGDALLDEALRRAAAKQGKRPQGAVAALGKGVRARTYERLVAAGLLRAESGRAFGVVPTHRWPAVESAHEDALRLRLASALRSGWADDARVAALVSLVRALDVLPKVFDPDEVGVTKKEMKANAKQVAEGDWASDAVRRAVADINAAVVAAVAAAVVASGSS